MEDRRESREVKLDLLKALMSDALFRKVGVQDRSDRPWRTLVQALRHAIPDEDITEIEVRRRLLEVYRQETLTDGASNILEAKMNDEFSFFCKGGYESVEEAKEHWIWYLCCLSYEEETFECGVKLLRHLKNHVTDVVHKIDLKPAVVSDFSVAFNFACKVCYSDYNLACGGVIFEAAQQGVPVLQLVFGCGERQGCLLLKIDSKSGYGKSGHKEPMFAERPGFISGIGEILKATMTVAAAKQKAATLPNCRGFSFKGPDNGQAVEIFFKDTSTISVNADVYDPYGARYTFPGDWKSLIMEEPGLQEWLVSKPLHASVWHEVMLEKGPRHLSLRVEVCGYPDAPADQVEWVADELADPFYSELNACDSLTIGAGRDGVNSVKLTGGWLADAHVTVGERLHDRSRKPEPDMIRMPLDRIDLQAIANAFDTEIIVDHLNEKSWIFTPSHTEDLCRHARLLRYVDLWAAMTSRRAFEDEPFPLTGALVELGSSTTLPAHLRSVSNRAVSVLAYETDVDAYRACVDKCQNEFLISRSSINRVIYHDIMLDSMRVEDDGPELLKQVPTKSLSFYLLWQLIKQQASHRLQTCHLVAKGSLPPEALRQTVKGPSHQFSQSRPAITAGASAMQLPLQNSSSSQQVADAQDVSSGDSVGSNSQLGAQGFKPGGKDEVPRPRRSAVVSSAPVVVAPSSFVASKSSAEAVPSPVHCMAMSSNYLHPLSSDFTTYQYSYVESSYPSSTPYLTRCSLDEARAEIAAGRQLMLSAVSAFKPFAPGQLQLKPLDQVFVVEFRELWAKCHFTSRRPDLAEWCPINKLTLWRVRARFKPEKEWPAIFDQCLPLEIGQDVVVSQIFEDDGRTGWARGRIYNSDDPSAASREGIFRLANLSQEVYVVQKRL